MISNPPPIIFDHELADILVDLRKNPLDFKLPKTFLGNKKAVGISHTGYKISGGSRRNVPKKNVVDLIRIENPQKKVVVFVVDSFAGRSNQGFYYILPHISYLTTGTPSNRPKALQNIQKSQTNSFTENFLTIVSVINQFKNLNYQKLSVDMLAVRLSWASCGIGWDEQDNIFPTENMLLKSFIQPRLFAELETFGVKKSETLFQVLQKYQTPPLENITSVWRTKKFLATWLNHSCTSQQIGRWFDFTWSKPMDIILKSPEHAVLFDEQNILPEQVAYLAEKFSPEHSSQKFFKILDEWLSFISPEKTFWYTAAGLSINEAKELENSKPASVATLKTLAGLKTPVLF